MKKQQDAGSQIVIGRGQFFVWNKEIRRDLYPGFASDKNLSQIKLRVIGTGHSWLGLGFKMSIM